VVTRHRSGSLSDDEVRRLYMGARAVIYPSFYEGFGFPIVTGLGHGLTVVARDSDLLDEVVAGCEPKGRLLTYRRRDELVDIVGALLHGDSLAERQVGRSFAPDHRKNWDEVGRDILRFVEQVVAQPSGGRWRRRERVVQQLLASRG
jgi:glycosyltransferase involved in cell wall biosynthesis